MTLPKLLPLLAPALLPLALTACKTPGKAQTQPTPLATTGSQPGANPNEPLLAAALANPATASRQACVVLPGLGSEHLFTREIYQSDSQGEAATRAGYYQVSEKPFRFAFAQKYKNLLAHSSNPRADTTRLCLGVARVQRLQNVQQVNPDKVIAEGVTRVQYEPWATEEVRTLFGPGRNHPMFQPIRMICLRNGTWTCEKY